MTPGPRTAARMPRLLQLHLLVVLLAFTAILGRLIGLPAPALVAWRTALVGAGLGLSLPAPPWPPSAPPHGSRPRAAARWCRRGAPCWRCSASA